MEKALTIYLLLNVSIPIFFLSNDIWIKTSGKQLVKRDFESKAVYICTKVFEIMIIAITYWASTTCQALYWALNLPYLIQSSKPLLLSHFVNKEAKCSKGWENCPVWPVSRPKLEPRSLISEPVSLNTLLLCLMKLRHFHTIFKFLRTQPNYLSGS